MNWIMAIHKSKIVEIRNYIYNYGDQHLNYGDPQFGLFMDLYNWTMDRHTWI